MEISKIVREFLVENFLFGVEDIIIENDTSFLESGIVDSTGILELVEYLEKTFSIRVEDEELTPENLDTISNVDRYISGKLRR